MKGEKGMANNSSPLFTISGMVDSIRSLHQSISVSLRKVHQSIAECLRNAQRKAPRSNSSGSEEGAEINDSAPGSVTEEGSQALSSEYSTALLTAGDLENQLQIALDILRESESDTRRASLNVSLMEPIVCRNPGLPFSRIEQIAGGDQRSQLWDLLDDGEFVDCLATMNHGALASLKSRRRKWRPDRRPSDIRRAELTLYRYLARFCSRNDTTGTAGTITWGKLGDGRTEVVPSPAGKKRTVWASPRHIELLSNRAAFGILRERATLVLFPRYQVTDGDVLDRHMGEPMRLTGEEQALVRKTVSSGTVFGELSLQEKECAERLVNGAVLTLRIGRPCDDQLHVLRELSQGTALQDDMERLVDIREQLQVVREEEFASLMEEADRIASRHAAYEVLDLTRILPFLLSLALSDPATEIVLSRQMKLAGDILTDPSRGACRLAGRELEMVKQCQARVHSVDFREYHQEIFGLMQEGILTLAGADCCPPGLSLEERFRYLAKALAATELSEPLASAAGFLAAASTDEPVKLSPVEAEAQLGHVLGPHKQKFLTRGVDRSFFICDSSRAVQSFSIGRKLRKRLEEQLRPWFRFAGWEEYVRERMMKPTLQKVIGDTAEVPLSRFLDDLAEAHQCNRTDPEFLAIREQYIEEDRAKWRLVSYPDRPYLSLEETGSDPEFEKWLGEKRLVTTMDVMLGGTSGELEEGGGTIVLSEAHWGSYGLGETTFFPHTHSEQSMQGHGRRIYGDDMVFLQPSRPNKLSAGILIQMQDIILGLNNPEGWVPQDRTIPISNLLVMNTPVGLGMSDGEKSYNIITSQLSIGDIRAVSAPINAARWESASSELIEDKYHVEFFPEIRLGDLIIARSTVQAPVEMIREMLAMDPGGKRLREALKLPRFVFVKTGKKPMMCDFDCPISMEVLAAEAEKADEITISPMQPAPDDLWLHLDDGAYTSELRIAVVCDGENFVQGKPQSGQTARKN